MLNKKHLIYNFAAVIIALGTIHTVPAFARNHHKNGPPPPVTVLKKDTHLNPQQSFDDISPFAKQAAANARQQQTNIQPNDIKGKDGPAALLPGHYTTKRSQKVNGNQGWVNSKRQRGKYDMGINMPVPQTADPTQNKTRGVFRRAMPVYEPNY